MLMYFKSDTNSLHQETMPHVAGTRAVYTAIGTNFIVLVTKVGALAMTGSASVLSEVVHSVADLLNQCLLAVGIYQSQKEPDQAHP
jgi:divalent metal cation (Fe/Co/Zn/Cd) transporter